MLTGKIRFREQTHLFTKANLVLQVEYSSKVEDHTGLDGPEYKAFRDATVEDLETVYLYLGGYVDQKDGT